MRYFDTPTDMFKAREKNSRKKAEAKFAKYIEKKEEGNYKYANILYAKSQEDYKSAKDYAKQAIKYRGISWKELKGAKS